MGLEPRPSGFVQDLCVALAHRWEPESLFVILKAYFDESGTHGTSPVTIMGGLLGSARQWSRFQTGIDRLKKQYGFEKFHTQKYKAKSGDFYRWPDEKRIALYL